jgi:hypothetical protein
MLGVALILGNEPLEVDREKERSRDVAVTVSGDGTALVMYNNSRDSGDNATQHGYDIMAGNVAQRRARANLVNNTRE